MTTPGPAPATPSLRTLIARAQAQQLTAEATRPRPSAPETAWDAYDRELRYWNRVLAWLKDQR